MFPRPHNAMIRLRCTAPECQCEQFVSARMYQSGDGGEMFERPLPPICDQCAHATVRHATAAVEKQAPIERRARPR